MPIDADDLPGFAARLYDHRLERPELLRLVNWDRLERDGAGIENEAVQAALTTRSRRSPGPSRPARSPRPSAPRHCSSSSSPSARPASTLERQPRRRRPPQAHRRRRRPTGRGLTPSPVLMGRKPAYMSCFRPINIVPGSEDGSPGRGCRPRPRPVAGPWSPPPRRRPRCRRRSSPPGRTMTPPPSQTLSPIAIGAAASSFPPRLGLDRVVSGQELHVGTDLAVGADLDRRHVERHQPVVDEGPRPRSEGSRRSRPAAAPVPSPPRRASRAARRAPPAPARGRSVHSSSYSARQAVPPVPAPAVSSGSSAM